MLGVRSTSQPNRSSSGELRSGVAKFERDIAETITAIVVDDQGIARQQ
jgi:hypothetical protein